MSKWGRSAGPPNGSAARLAGVEPQPHQISHKTSKRRKRERKPQEQETIMKRNEGELDANLKLSAAMQFATGAGSALSLHVCRSASA